MDRYLNIFSVALLALIVESTGTKDGLTVNTPYGTYKGYLTKTAGGRELITFKGVPFAQPPVGALRFKEPVKLEKKNVTLNATKERTCFQIPGVPVVDFRNPQNGPKFIGNEDCLYLNIYRPKDVPLEKLLPVYFWIHAGAFSSGSATETWNGPTFLLDGKRDMMFVAPNYRLGVLGFLAANDDNLPGNIGLKDQTMALKWVNENIKLFGGDPKSVTIGGLSAGAASVAHHINSKSSKGLFQRAISHSGTADCGWARKSKEESREMASKIISHLGCPSEPTKLLECLQSLPGDDVLYSKNILRVNKTGLILHLVPVAEKDSPTAFMTEESIAAGSDVPWLTGVTNHEALFFYQVLVAEEPSYLDLSILKNHYKELFPILAYYDPALGEAGLTEELRQFYFGDKEFGRDTVENFIQMLSDTMFNHALVVSARNHKGKLFMYKLSYKGDNSIFELNIKGFENGVAHGDDMIYFFNAKFGKMEELKGKDLEFSNTLVDTWYNFIKTGDPSPDNHQWKESEGGKKYLEFTNDGPVMSSDLYPQRMKFLDKEKEKWKIHDGL